MKDREDMYINKISQENIKEFVIDTLKKYENKELKEEANKVCHAMYQLMEDRGLITTNGDPRLVDSMIASAMLHNLFITKESISIFEARAKLEKVANNDYKIGIGMTDAIFQTIEGQFGEDSFIPSCRPTPNTPTELFYIAKWIVTKYREFV